MFGQDDNQQQQQSDAVSPLTDPQALNAAMPDPITPNPPTDFNIQPNPLAPTAPAADFGPPELPALGTPDPINPTVIDPTAPAQTADDTSDQPADDLVGIKQQALQHLSPLVSHLDQTPEEKFRTTMMMIQASDNKDLIKDAFEAAQAISDDKARAQALLDVINEINYFTSQHEN